MSRSAFAAASVVAFMALAAAVTTGCPRLVTTALAIVLGCAVSAFGTSIAFTVLEKRTAARRARRYALRHSYAASEVIVLKPIQASVPRLVAPAPRLLRAA